MKGVTLAIDEAHPVGQVQEPGRARRDRERAPAPVRIELQMTHFAFGSGSQEVSVSDRACLRGTVQYVEDADRFDLVERVEQGDFDGQLQGPVASWPRGEVKPRGGPPSIARRSGGAMAMPILAPRMAATATPTRRPRVSATGPPLFPGLRAPSIKTATSFPSSFRRMLDTLPLPTTTVGRPLPWASP